MDRLRSMQVFLEVSRRGSFAGAARHLGMSKSPTSIWRFSGPEGAASVRVRGTVYSNFGEALKQAALLGHGISVHPYYMVSAELAARKLAVVLPRYEPEAYDISVIYSSRHNLPVRVRRFVDFLKEWAKTPPDWSAHGRTARGKPASRR